METKDELGRLIRQYLSKYPDELEATSPLIDFIDTHDDLINRKNFAGHITASAFIINRERHSLLLLKHKSLERWLQPGGHVDQSDVLLKAAALREAMEETGLAAEDLILVSDQIFDVNSHPIPENRRKEEPAHVHHDIRYLFQYSNRGSITISQEESTDSKWIPFSVLKSDPDFYWVEEKIRQFV